MKTRTFATFRTGGPRAGTTLIETMIGLALFSTFAAAVFLAVDASAGSYGTEATAARLDVRAREAMDALSVYLREADFASLTPPAVIAPASADTVEFQRPVGLNLGVIQWGPNERLTLETDPSELEDGLDNDGDGRIDEGRVVWVENPLLPGSRRLVLCTDVSATLEGESAGNGLDDNGNGLIDEPGFCLEFVGTRMIVRLTLEGRDPDGNLLRRSAMRTMTPRNTPED